MILATAAFLFLAAAPAREVAITIDDLPRGGDGIGCEAAPLLSMTEKLLAPFRSGHLPVTGFVIGTTCPEVQTRALKMWLDAGAVLGNHTYSHLNPNDTPAPEYVNDIELGAQSLRKITGAKPRYFRLPFLHAGKDAETKKTIADFLQSHGYINAPVTLDNSDYMFARVYGIALKKNETEKARRVADAYLTYMESIYEFFEKRSIEVTGHEVRQTLLIHASQLNADTMPRLLEMMKRRGYQVVSLERALEDPAYRLPDRYIGPRGISWIHRWATTVIPEPDEPKWITDAWNASRR